NGKPATAAYLRDAGTAVAEIVGQHEAQRLLAPAYHVELLDRFAGPSAAAARDLVADRFAAKREIAQRLSDLDKDERRAQEQAAFARFALEEIHGVNPRDGEDGELTARRRILDNAEKIANALAAVRSALSEGDGAAADALGGALAAIEQLAGIGSQYDEMASQLRALQSETNDLAATAARESEAIEFDPGELESINARLDALDTLKRKYGGSIEAVLASERDFAATLDAYDNKDEHRKRLERELNDASAALAQTAAELSKIRAAAAKRLKKSVESEFADLALPSARFETGFDPLPEIGAHGAEEIEFLFAANKGEDPRRLSKGASGGELSRVLLALIVALAGARETTALIFDEIDAGIGGATASAVAARLARLAEHGQVVCVTHLAQIASRADAHYILQKTENKTAASIDVVRVAGDGERAAEIARMLSGESHDVALQHARTLLRQGP
ncbi:MAG TPA: hypothetical protein VFL13_10910, partial [Candidatus Baltobacteraceae bacterium]|nr:hypothetical protein [Candidatus Baltobacteraceae bacterium]